MALKKNLKNTVYQCYLSDIKYVFVIRKRLCLLVVKNNYNDDNEVQYANDVIVIMIMMIHCFIPRHNN